MHSIVKHKFVKKSFKRAAKVLFLRELVRLTFANFRLEPELKGGVRRLFSLTFFLQQKITIYFTYRIFSNKRPRSFKRPSPINAPRFPVIIL